MKPMITLQRYERKLDELCDTLIVGMIKGCVILAILLGIAVVVAQYLMK